jgi:hypothetical protein
LRFCSFCGCDRKDGDRCPDCGDASYSIRPNRSHQKYLRKTGRIRTTKLIVAGPEYLDGEAFVKRKLNSLCQNLKDIQLFIAGKRGIAKNIDSWASHDIRVGAISFFPVEPGKDKRAMGIKRNEEIIEESGAKQTIIFNDGEDSIILSLILMCRKAGIVVRVVNLPE